MDEATVVTTAEVLASVRVELRNAERRLAEFHSAVSGVATRIGCAARPEWVKGQLERVLLDFRDMKGGA